MTPTSLLTSPTPVATRGPRALTLAELATIARGLAETAHGWPDVNNPEERTWHTIARTEQFEAFVIAWPSGSRIDFHDHGDAAGVVAVTAGELVETAVLDIAGTRGLYSHRLTPGMQLAFRAGHVHDLANPGSWPALSVHVYSPVLSTMTFFEASEDASLVPLRTETLEVEGAS